MTEDEKTQAAVSLAIMYALALSYNDRRRIPTKRL